MCRHNRVVESTSAQARSTNTQIFTPPQLAEFMAELLVDGSELRLLDPGSGPGILAEAVVTRAHAAGVRVGGITLVEQDPFLAIDASSAVQELADVDVDVVCADFVEWALDEIAQERKFTHAVLNPPYAKLRRDAPLSRALREHGADVPNLYAAFLWLSMALLVDGGVLVAVVPRSFLNGSTFSRLRRYFAHNATLTAVHHFKSRRAVFARDGILQEVVVVRFERGSTDANVRVSSSIGLDDLASSQPFHVPSSRVRSIDPDDLAILIPSAPGPSLPDNAPLVIDAKLRVQTGSVVDFRNAAKIVSEPQKDSVPLIGSECFVGHETMEISPEDARRHLILTSGTISHVRSQGTYIVSRRISPRERHPRLDVRIVDTSRFHGGVAFENHVNVISSTGEGLTRSAGLDVLALLTRDEIDRQLEERLSSTQVNASDLRQLRYVSTDDPEVKK